MRDWTVTGPFPGGNYRGLARRFAPEKEMSLTEWKPAEAEPDGWLDLRRALGVPSGVGYARTYVNSPTERLVNLLLGTGGGTRVWLNGNLVWKHEASHRAVPHLDQVVVPLRAGLNSVLVKVKQHQWGKWGVCLRFSGGPGGLTYEVPR